MGKRPFYIITISYDYDGDISSDVLALSRKRSDAVARLNYVYDRMYDEAVAEYGDRMEAEGNIVKQITINDEKERPLSGSFYINDEYRNDYISGSLIEVKCNMFRNRFMQDNFVNPQDME